MKQTDEKLDVSDVTLTFDNVTFSYDQHSHVLDRFSFTLRQGEKMALLGNIIMQLHLPRRTLNIFITRLTVSEPDIVHNARVKEMRFLIQNGHR